MRGALSTKSSELRCLTSIGLLVQNDRQTVGSVEASGSHQFELASPSQTHFASEMSLR